MSYYCENPTCPNPTVVQDKKKRSKCSTCLSVYYCSAECQRLDWKSHKTRCMPLKDMTILDILMMRHECPLNAVVGSHIHPTVVGSTDKQLQQTSFLQNCISELPKHAEYRLSCACNTRIHNKKLDRWRFRFHIHPEVIYVGLWCYTCPDIVELKPLIALVCPSNVTKYQIYATIPYHKTKQKPNIGLFNLNCDHLDPNARLVQVQGFPLLVTMNSANGTARLIKGL